MSNLAALPRDFDALLAKVPEGFSVSERVVEPVAILSRVSGKMSVALGGKRMVRGEVRLIEAPSISHAWIADGAILRPLPNDAPGLVAKCLGGEAPAAVVAEHDVEHAGGDEDLGDGREGAEGRCVHGVCLALSKSRGDHAVTPSARATGAGGAGSAAA